MSIRDSYTACEPCKDNPERPPLWQVRAARIIHKKSEQTIYYEAVSYTHLDVYKRQIMAIVLATGFIFYGARIQPMLARLLAPLTTPLVNLAARFRRA